VWTSSKLEKLVKDWRKDAVNDFEDNYEQVVPDLADSFLYQYGNSLRDYFNKIGLTSRSAQKEYISDLLV